MAVLIWKLWSKKLTLTFIMIIINIEMGIENFSLRKPQRVTEDSPKRFWRDLTRGIVGLSDFYAIFFKTKNWSKSN